MQQLATMSKASESSYPRRSYVMVETAGPIHDGHKVYFKVQAVDEMGEDSSIIPDARLKCSRILGFTKHRPNLKPLTRVAIIALGRPRLD